ncbi:hypothetical protein J2T55_002435 [Methylohalomonas lacus]|uniref:Uncharacterized protein n=1 Tax=Methylohalomonas lacus TaxID=398773 RepID=A0AAE3HLE7_9GAMM|nr:hypothetical protein [Methylohalomonas lacus]MCS3904399.1 hypothetical protein [Methylohalomonas lacus]
MARLTNDERRALRELAAQQHDEPPLTDDERFVAPTAEARARYIRFATEASRFYRGDKPVRFVGNHWKL